jgi:hypothetical protein
MTEGLDEFKNDFKELTSLKILALKEPESDVGFKFYPIFRTVVDGIERDSPFEVQEISHQKPEKSEIVASVFKEMIHQNWKELEAHLIDDLLRA